MDESARSRSRERWLRQQATESARFTGVALDLAERQARVTVRTTVGRSHHGVIVAVAPDFVAVRTDAGAATLLSLPHVAFVRADSGAVAAGDRPPSFEARLTTVVAGLAGDRPRVHVVLDGGESLTGELRSAGLDVATLQLDGESAVFVHLGALAEVTVLDQAFGSG
jgi:hypothetical protein